MLGGPCRLRPPIRRPSPPPDNLDGRIDRIEAQMGHIEKQMVCLASKAGSARKARSPRAITPYHQSQPTLNGSRTVSTSDDPIATTKHPRTTAQTPTAPPKTRSDPVQMAHIASAAKPTKHPDTSINSPDRSAMPPTSRFGLIPSGANSHAGDHRPGPRLRLTVYAAPGIPSRSCKCPNVRPPSLLCKSHIRTPCPSPGLRSRSELRLGLSPPQYYF